MTRAAASGVVGGTVASATGGNFWDGFETGAASRLFNDEAAGHQESPQITTDDLTNKSEADIRNLAQEKGLVLDKNKLGKWRDPVTNKERLRLDPAHFDKITGKPFDKESAARPHVHGYDENHVPIRDEFGDSHFPLQTATRVMSIITRTASRISFGMYFLLHSEDAY